MKSFPQRLFGDKPMDLWMKIAGTFMSVFMMPSSSITLLVVTQLFGQLNPMGTAQTNHIVAVAGIVICIMGLLFSIYSTWYLWVKIPLIKNGKGI